MSGHGSGEHRIGERPTAPPGPEDEAALEHALKLAALEPSPQRLSSGLMRELAHGWIALGGGKGAT